MTNYSHSKHINIYPSILSSETNMKTMLVYKWRFLIIPLYGKNKRKVVQNPAFKMRAVTKTIHKLISKSRCIVLEKDVLHVHPILIINLFLEVLSHFSIKNFATQNSTHLWFPHFKLWKTNNHWTNQTTKNEKRGRRRLLKAFLSKTYSIPRRASFLFDHHEEPHQDSQRCQIFALEYNKGGNNKSTEAEF